MTDSDGVGRAERWRRLLDLVAQRGRLGVEEAARELEVSAATIRRDFAALADQQFATRTHGGIVATSVAYDLPAQYRATSTPPHKQRVAAAAAALVTPGSVVGLNGGTTTTAAARALSTRAALVTQSEDDQVTLVTNALNIATEMVLRPHLRTVCVGGVARAESYELYGPYASRVLDKLRFDLLLLGVDALTVDGGAQCRHLGESGINAEMVSRAHQVVVVTTNEKLTRTALAEICPITAIDRLVTDDGADAEAVKAIRAAGVTVDLV
ncbi:DeoR/GlpR family DNA-binding transcription regulator [Solicola gregarius]|uniref:DeoR/GlpR family DNA-binding transcription regulator n=1 Tax=Solicola gregarius TaxID=2908642 RepID=A0AA46YK57_9ACTN|nr:DeoR/GlpR family DNA-binding transcription regulator [Solicola gregarius]UYM04151.1 DeoR/GlpR family DNA-binding transcription regulator [Solicola gregarius]